MKMTMNSEKIMSEAENLELETEVEVESNSTIDLINALQRGDFSEADRLFKDSLGTKVQDTLDAEKVAVAGQIFNGEEPYNAEDDESDEVYDDIVSELEEVEDINLDEVDDFDEVE